MADIESAKKRLEQAVDRLETAVETVTSDGNPKERISALEADRARLGSELSALRSQNDEMAKRLNGLQQDYGALEKLLDRVSDRLDSTIGRLRSVVDG